MLLGLLLYVSGQANLGHTDSHDCPHCQAAVLGNRRFDLPSTNEHKLLVDRAERAQSIVQIEQGEVEIVFLAKSLKQAEVESPPPERSVHPPRLSELRRAFWPPAGSRAPPIA